MSPLSVAKNSFLIPIGLALGYRHQYHPPPVAVYRKLPLGAHGAAAHQRYWNPSPAAYAVGHCRRLRLPLCHNADAVDQVPRVSIVAGVHHTIGTPH